MSLPVVVTPPVISAMRTDHRGGLEISGVTQIAGVPAPCRVHLHSDEDGRLIGFRRTDSTGVYAFPGLIEGDYYLVITDDRSGSRRSKVEHIRL